MEKHPMKGIYLHIPFCLAKCAYCDFASQPLADPARLPTYLQALSAELEARVSGPVDTVYFGGGTPSLCAPGQIAGLLRTLAGRAQMALDAEVTLEANPATADLARWSGFRAAGVNRISLGVQSTQDPFLRLLGRKHTAQQAEEQMRLAKKAGFSNLSCDLIFGLPGQTLAQFQADLQTLLSWEPAHVSLYGLTLEPGTLLAHRVQQGELPAPDEDAAADMYESAREILPASGWLQYELSNFALPGRECRHNLKYWTDQEYLGLGASAHSYIRGVRSWNPTEPEAYVQARRQASFAPESSEKLKERRKIAEDMIIGLRLTAGIEKERLRRCHGDGWKELFISPIRDMLQAGLLAETTDRLFLTARGMLLSNVVFRAML
jgi:oxygen-independent coproporphyrinogen-3 oxidase